MQTPEGAIKARQTLIAKYGSEQGWRDHMREVGALGGKVSNPNKGFGGMSPEKRAEAGRKGGRQSKRTAKVTEAEA